ncbi:Sulfur oxidation protein SoxB [hydrothermal vent metagenome]|uniref:Sulfur oxidation protein SoxB n=1 Tax=hydrothermal vent metagenome TaxID=652676 RepID=A0A3B1E5B2_9ZZZZ
MSQMSRREFVYMTALLAGTAPVFAKSHTRLANTKKHKDYYKLDSFGNARIMHMTDSHAQLLPVYFREPSVNLGFHTNYGKPPHIVGKRLLKRYGIQGNKRLEYAFTQVNFEEHAKVMGRVGGFAQIKTVVDFLKSNFGSKDKSILLDGGDTWQGSATALYTRGKDMVGAMNLLGVDVAVGHWEFTYKAAEILENVKLLDADFIAQNIHVKDDALMDGSPAYDEDSGLTFKPYVIKKMGNARVAIIGQAFPYTTIANPQRNIPDWTFGIKEDNMQEMVNEVREKEKPDAVIVLSHNGFDVDQKMAKVCTGIDFIMGGHTHDGVPEAIPVKNKKGTTYVCNAGSNGKFLNVLDLDIQKGKIKDFKFTLLPIFSDLIDEDKTMKKYITSVRKPFLKDLNRKLATTDETLFRRGNFNGSWDQIICDSLIEIKGADVSLSPGFRWGTTIMPGQTITFDDLMTQTALTYPETYVREFTGAQIKATLEDVADNLFNTDPFLQSGGDMVRTGGISYTINPKATIGKRVTNITMTKTGKKMDAKKKYKVAGWSTVNSIAPGKPIWEITEEYLKNIKHISNLKIDTPDMIGVKGNPGITSDTKGILS